MDKISKGLRKYETQSEKVLVCIGIGIIRHNSQILIQSILFSAPKEFLYEKK